MIVILLIAAAVVGVVLYSHHKHLSAIAEVKDIVTSLRLSPVAPPVAASAPPKTELP